MSVAQPGTQIVDPAVYNGLFVGTINRVGQEPEFGSNDYYGTSYFADPRGQYVPDLGTGVLMAWRPAMRPCGRA